MEKLIFESICVSGLLEMQFILHSKQKPKFFGGLPVPSSSEGIQDHHSVHCFRVSRQKGEIGNFHCTRKSVLGIQEALWTLGILLVHSFYELLAAAHSNHNECEGRYNFQQQKLIIVVPMTLSNKQALLGIISENQQFRTNEKIIFQHQSHRRTHGSIKSTIKNVVDYYCVDYV